VSCATATFAASDAQQRLEAGAERDGGLPGGGLVGLAIETAALGVPDLGKARPDLGELGGRHLAGVGALGLGRDVLPADPHGGVGERRDRGGDLEERRRDEDLDGSVHDGRRLGDARRDLAEPVGRARMPEVHLQADADDAPCHQQLPVVSYSVSTATLSAEALVSSKR
jgi:hypothetical protein